jgi:hypothetical protein
VTVRRVLTHRCAWSTRPSWRTTWDSRGACLPGVSISVVFRDISDPRPGRMSPAYGRSTTTACFCQGASYEQTLVPAITG